MQPPTIVAALPNMPWGTSQGAIKDYGESLRLGLKDNWVYNNRGAAKYALRDFQGAIKDYDGAIRLNAEVANTYNSRGWQKRV